MTISKNSAQATKSTLANDIIKDKVSTKKPVEKAPIVKKATKKALLDYLHTLSTISYAKGWEKGLLSGLSGGKTNQCLELYFLDRSLKAAKINLHDKEGKKVDLSEAVAYAKGKLDAKVKFWLKWEGIHSQSFKAVFERLENREYPNSVIALLNREGYTFK